MNKFYGNVGYGVTEEVSPGVWRPTEKSRPYHGEWLKYTAKFQTSSDSTNDDKNVANELSIVADPYAFEHFSNMRYVEFMGAKWKITSVRPERPRIILTIGGLWHNGKQANTAE